MKKEIVIRVTKSERELINIVRMLEIDSDKVVIDLLDKHVKSKMDKGTPEG